MSERAYLNMLRFIMFNGTIKEDRTGTGTRSVFGYQLRFDMQNGFPLITTKYVDFKNIATELLWFLSGSTNVKPLVDEGCNIWIDWPLKRYNKAREAQGGSPISRKEFIQMIKENKDDFANFHGDLGPVYGYQWRNWNGCTEDGGVTPIDQIYNSIEMLKKSPDSRRNIVSAWNVSDIDEMAISGLPPCHFAFQWNTRPLNFEQRLKIARKVTPIEMSSWTSKWNINPDTLTAALSIILNEDQGPLTREANMDIIMVPSRYLDVNVSIRSWDTFLGGPYNIASYALLLHMFAQCVGMQPGQLVISSGDTHIYSNHFEAVKLQLHRTPQPSPTLILNPLVKNIENFNLEDFKIINYQYEEAIKGAIAV